ncbi:MAG TPA: GTP 3',8-cyclase MoaA [Phenylobacterium sp.]|uniref:GTP 3',8-cyclase MoaA n=1 Tax=Phenylobacterium sp. TaxID=1871053 RepID=UPI002F957951
MDRLVDGFGRRFNYLRLSVTEVCNFRCTYCLPDGYRKSGPTQFLNVEEIGFLTEAFARLGVHKVRLTGGEPTVRRDIGQIIAKAAQTAGIDKVAMTTNGWNLARRIGDWHAAGLTHLNVSIDSLDGEAFHRITGHDRLRSVVEGVDRALGLGMASVKVNAVLLKETAESGLGGFADFVRERPVAVRFIELMRTNDNADYFAAHHASGQVLRDWLEREGWTSRARGADDGPAVEYVHPDYAGRLGLIAPYAAGFCDGCNRLRVTSRGLLRLCLFGEGGVDLRELLTEGRGEELQERIVASLIGKRAGHALADGLSGDTRNLAQLGG